jgi:hypothetical protein
MVVYGRKSPTNRCNIFEELWPEQLKEDENILIRDWDRRIDEAPDLSLSRCSTTTTPFLPSSIKDGTPTPGK